MLLSVVVLAKNESAKIQECLHSLRFCDEIIVIDDQSDDATKIIAREEGARVYTNQLKNNFAAQRNFGLEKAKSKWVLFIDADERVPEALASEIRNLKFSIFKSQTSFVCGYYMKRFDVMWGRELIHGETGSVKLLRLARKNAGVWKRKVHEYWDVKCNVGLLKNPLIHYSHESVNEFIDKINFYSTLHARQKYEDGEYSNIIKILLYPILKFFNNWILRLGFLDGTPGLLATIFMCMHSFLGWGKLWLLQKKH